MLCFKESFLTPTTNACGVGPPSKEEGVMGASSEIRFSLKEVLLTPTTNRVAVGPPSPTIGEGAIQRIIFLLSHDSRVALRQGSNKEERRYKRASP